jgi:hypothetical protein
MALSDVMVHHAFPELWSDAGSSNHEHVKLEATPQLKEGPANHSVARRLQRHIK